MIFANETDPSVEVYHMLNIFLVSLGWYFITYYTNFYHL